MPLAPLVKFHAAVVSERKVTIFAKLVPVKLRVAKSAPVPTLIVSASSI